MSHDNKRRAQQFAPRFKVLTSRQCARVFVFVFARVTQPFFLRREYLSSIAASVEYFFWENLWHGKLNLNFWIVRRKWCCCCTRDIQREMVSCKPSRNKWTLDQSFSHPTRRHLMAKYISLRNAANNSQSTAAGHMWRILAHWWQVHLVPTSKLGKKFPLYFYYYYYYYYYYYLEIVRK